jgi:hypothetical protein
MKNKEEVDVDFGFSFIDEDLVETAERYEVDLQDRDEQIRDLENRLHLLYDSIIPFLDNLCTNPDKTTIYWPDRIEKIRAYKKKLFAILEGSKNG